MGKYQNKYRIGSARAQWWDYGWNGAYFITICTKNRKHFFGEIQGEKMILSHVGVIANILWHEIPNHSKFVELGDFVVMPNHIHGILILDKPDDINDNVGTNNNPDSVVETGHAPFLQTPEQTPEQQSHTHTSNPSTIGQKRSRNIRKNTVSSIIGSYKSAVTKYANRLGYENGWQERFHDHIIRSDTEYQRISNYIIHNPANWKDDNYF